MCIPTLWVLKCWPWNSSYMPCPITSCSQTTPFLKSFRGMVFYRSPSKRWTPSKASFWGGVGSYRWRPTLGLWICHQCHYSHHTGSYDACVWFCLLEEGQLYLPVPGLRKQVPWGQGTKTQAAMKNRPQNKTLSHSKVPWFTGYLLILDIDILYPALSPSWNFSQGTNPQPQSQVAQVLNQWRDSAGSWVAGTTPQSKHSRSF